MEFGLIVMAFLRSSLGQSRCACVLLLFVLIKVRMRIAPQNEQRPTIIVCTGELRA